MAQFETFILVILVFWIGYERFNEIFMNWVIEGLYNRQNPLPTDLPSTVITTPTPDEFDTLYTVARTLVTVLDTYKEKLDALRNLFSRECNPCGDMTTKIHDLHKEVDETRDKFSDAITIIEINKIISAWPEKLVDEIYSEGAKILSTISNVTCEVKDLIRQCSEKNGIIATCKSALENEGITKLAEEIEGHVKEYNVAANKYFTSKAVSSLKNQKQRREEQMGGIKKVWAYGIAALVGLIFYLSGFSLFTVLQVDFSGEFPKALYESVKSWFDLLVTVFIFAGGPDLIHQIMSLIQENKLKAKLTNLDVESMDKLISLIKKQP